MLGEKISELINSFQKSGKHKIVWNAKDYASGVYFYTLKAGDFSSTKKIILMK